MSRFAPSFHMSFKIHMLSANLIDMHVCLSAPSTLSWVSKYSIKSKVKSVWFYNYA